MEILETIINCELGMVNCGKPICCHSCERGIYKINNLPDLTNLTDLTNSKFLVLYCHAELVSASCIIRSGNKFRMTV